MHAFVYDPTFIQDAKVYRMRAQLPSMSVPNWLSLITVRWRGVVLEGRDVMNGRVWMHC